MSRRIGRTSFLLPLVVAAAACTGGGSSEPVKSPEAGPVEDAVKTTSETPAGGRVAANSPLAGKDERAGTVRPFAGDDPGKAVAIPGKRGWSLGPGDAWTVGLYEFVRSEGTKNVFKAPGEPDFAIPGAYTFPATPAKGQRKGAPVLVPVESETACGRVVSASETAIEVAYIFDTKKVVKSFAPDQVLPLDGKLGYGAPVAYKGTPDAKTFALGWLVYQDGKTAWLVGATRVDVGAVRPIDVVKEYKAGDKVWAMAAEMGDSFQQVTLTKVLEDGLFYELKGSDGKARTAEVCSVTAALP
jgi:hypothetical protein